ncbi:MAG: DUF3300 domain-containing protein [Planctomycetota bacterium]|nr:DUF3300 domain-containing protein [Planctomycetota bacterium]
MNALTTTILLLPLTAPAIARQAVTPAEGAAQGTAPAQAFSAEQLEQIVAPIALYPDPLVAQLLIAATYPLEVVEAARWMQKNSKLQGEALEKELQQHTWDPSVKSLCGFPDVLKRMNENLDWTQDLGDAFLGQKKAVMDAVQVMRRKAYESGNLKSSKELKVEEQAGKIIVIQAADPEVIYVPTYYPSVVYGSWGYPYWYYPPMYAPPPAGGVWFGFSVGIIWGAAIWGGCNWGGTDIDIDINRQNNFINNTESSDRRQQVKDRAATKDGKWNHDPSHRKGVGYQDSKVAQKYGGSQGQNRVTRDQARGYGDRAATRPAGGPAGTGVGTGAVSRPGGGTVPDQRPGAGEVPTQRPGGGTVPAQRPATGAAGAAPANRAAARPTGQASGSFTGSRGASTAGASSSRGAASRGSGGARGGGGGRR